MGANTCANSLADMKSRPAHHGGHGHHRDLDLTGNTSTTAATREAGDFSHVVEVDWSVVNALLPIQKTKEARATRRRLFDRFDPNGNRILSLAEVDKGLLELLDLSGIRECRPAINRAFHAARTICPPVASFSNDYIDFREFRVLLVYVKFYVELWEFFNRIDTTGDRRVKLPEFQAAIPLLRRWGMDVDHWEADPATAFDTMDLNGGGVVLFDEFADFCLRHHVHKHCSEGGGDDEDRRSALEILQKRKANLTSTSYANVSTNPSHNWHKNHHLKNPARRELASAGQAVVGQPPTVPPSPFPLSEQDKEVRRAFKMLDAGLANRARPYGTSGMTTPATGYGFP